MPKIEPKMDVRCSTISAEEKQKLHVCTDLFGKGYLPQLANGVFRGQFKEVNITNRPPGSGGWALTWAFKKRDHRNSVIETGFFKTSMHVDTSGIYDNSSFNQPGGMDRVLQYQPPKDGARVILEGSFPQTKYRQHENNIRWDGIVLPLQVSCDRSVMAVGTSDDYWSFVESACKKYGKHLFLKHHPAAHSSDNQRANDLAFRSGCKSGPANMTLLDHCRFVLTYCSTFCVDAFVHEVPVAQYAPGYFYKTGCVTYTNGVLPDDVEDTKVVAYRLVDFLVWRYCFVFEQPGDQWARMLKRFAGSTQLFPMTEEFSYGANLEYINRDWNSFF